MNQWRINLLRLIVVLVGVGTCGEVRGAEPMKQGMASVNGTSLYYEIRGKGVPVVLISGGGTLDRRGWDEQFEAFAKYYKVIRFDIRGLGKSARPRQAFSHSQDLYALLRFLQVDKAHIVGLSFGGAIAIDFALDHAQMVDHLILAATGTSSDARGEANLAGIAALTDFVKTNGIQQASQLILNMPSFISKDNTAAHEKIRQIYQDNRDVFESGFPLVALWQPSSPPASERLAEISARTLILMGENDNPAYKEITEKLCAGIRGAKRVVIAGAPHLINLDKPKEFNQAVLEFLREK